jgi:hypothetical protein
VPDIDVVGAIAVALGVAAAGFLIVGAVIMVSGSQTLHWILGGGCSASCTSRAGLFGLRQQVISRGISPTALHYWTSQVSLQSPCALYSPSAARRSITRSWSTGVVLISLAWYRIT